MSGRCPTPPAGRFLFRTAIQALDADGLRRLGQAYLASLPTLADGKTRITDKMPSNFFHVGLIRLILPNARIIHTMRDPVDTCVSCFSRLFTHGQPFSYDLAELGRYYRWYHELMAHWRSVLPAGAMLDVSYEDVVDNLEEQARRLIDYCGLPWDDRCLSFHETSRPIATASNVQVRRPLYRSSRRALASLRSLSPAAAGRARWLPRVAATAIASRGAAQFAPTAVRVRALHDGPTIACDIGRFEAQKIRHRHPPRKLFGLTRIADEFRRKIGSAAEKIPKKTIALRRSRRYSIKDRRTCRAPGSIAIGESDLKTP